MLCTQRIAANGSSQKGANMLKLSARNQIEGAIDSVEKGAVNGIVAIKVGNEVIKADITNDAIDQLELKPGMKAIAIIKASSVMFATEKLTNISARNQLSGKIVKVNKGAVNGHVVIESPEGFRIKGSITNDAIEQLGFAEGSDATAIIKSTEVMVAI